MHSVLARVISGMIPFRNFRHKARQCLLKTPLSEGDTGNTMNKLETRYCASLYRSLDFSFQSLSHCCVAVSEQASAIAPFSGGSFPLKKYLKSVAQFRDDVINGQGPCQGCEFITKGIFPEKFSSFNYISFNNFNRCNLNCFYCAPNCDSFRHKPEITYNPVPTLEDMFARGFLSEDFHMAFGGGGTYLI